MYGRYLAGWGYLLSQDAVQLIVSKVDTYEQHPEQAPGWFAGLHWEDVLVGLLLDEYAEPQNRPNGTACFPHVDKVMPSLSRLYTEHAQL